MSSSRGKRRSSSPKPRGGEGRPAPGKAAGRGDAPHPGTAAKREDILAGHPVAEALPPEVLPAAAPPSVPLSLPIRTVRCPVCEYAFEQNCGGLEEEVVCPHCGCGFPYTDGYLNHYKAYIEAFIDPVHPIPLAPGYSTGGEVQMPPNDLLLVDFGVTYRREPEVFFLLPDGNAGRELLVRNLVVLPLSVSNRTLILFSHVLDRKASARAVPVRWMAIGETGEWEKPLWLNYLQNAADLVRTGEDVAALVMLMVVLDFFYDAMLERLGITYETIRRRGRRPGMNEKRAKLKLLEEHLGAWPGGIDDLLRDLTDYRNRIVHRVVKRPDAPEFTGRRAFQVVMRALTTLISMYHQARQGDVRVPSSTKRK